MKTIRALFIPCVVVLLTCNSCLYVSAWIMARDERTTIDTFKSGKYKARIQRRIGWAGPGYFHCRIKEKKLGGLYYHKIVSETFSWKDYKNCVIRYPVHRKDTLVINVCQKTAVLIKPSSNH